MFRHITLICATLLLLSGAYDCREALAATLPQNATASANETSPGKMLLQDPIELEHYELPFQALQKWYKFQDLRPALLLYSNDPPLFRKILWSGWPSKTGRLFVTIARIQPFYRKWLSTQHSKLACSQQYTG